MESQRLFAEVAESPILDVSDNSTTLVDMVKTGIAALAEDTESITATEAKNTFGSVLDRVGQVGRIAITKHDQVRAVVLSLREYEALLEGRVDPLESLRTEFDSLVENMQAPEARRAGRALFESTGKELGGAAVRAQRRR
jgi:prevent-host-death family protein